jgi:hypothetical protein
MSVGVSAHIVQSGALHDPVWEAEQRDGVSDRVVHRDRLLNGTLVLDSAQHFVIVHEGDGVFMEQLVFDILMRISNRFFGCGLKPPSVATAWLRGRGGEESSETYVEPAFQSEG